MRLDQIIGGAVLVVVILGALYGVQYVKNNWPVWKARLDEKFKKDD